MESDGQKSPLDPLTIRQREILLLIAEGQNTKQIARFSRSVPRPSNTIG